LLAFSFRAQPSLDAEEIREAVSIELQPPIADAEVRRVALQGSRLAALWSDGTLQSYDLDAAEQQQPRDGGGMAPTVSLPLRGFALSCPQVGACAINTTKGPLHLRVAQCTLAALTSKLLLSSGGRVGVHTCVTTAVTSHLQADTPAQPVEEPEAKVRKKRRKPLANGGVANGIPAPQPAPLPPAPLAPTLALLPGDHAVILGWGAASGADATAAPSSGGFHLMTFAFGHQYIPSHCLACSQASVTVDCRVCFCNFHHLTALLCAPCRRTPHGNSGGASLWQRTVRGLLASLRQPSGPRRGDAARHRRRR
jgi:hypothetical protein